MASAGLPAAPQDLHAAEQPGKAGRQERLDRFDRLFLIWFAIYLAAATGTIAIMTTRPGYLDALVNGIM